MQQILAISCVKAHTNFMSVCGLPHTMLGADLMGRATEKKARLTDGLVIG